MIKITLTIYTALVLLSAILFIPKLAQIFGAMKKPDKMQSKIKRRISILIPARNESAIIGALFDSIKRQDYDKEYFDVNVVVKEENDPTITLAKQIGANVFVVGNQTCKGDALDGYFHSVSREEIESYDAFVIVDADAVLSIDYVTQLNNALEYDKDIFVTRKNIKNFLGGKSSRSITSNCSALVYPMVDELGNLYRANKNVPLNLCGQGLMIRKNVILQLNGWPYRSLTEDYELKMDGFLRGFTSMYYPYAVLYTEEVVNHRESRIRRLRWLTGYSQCDKKYKSAIKKKIKEDNLSMPFKYDFLYFKIPIFVHLAATAFSVLNGIHLTLFYAIYGYSWWIPLLYLVYFPLLLTYFALVIYAFIAMLCYRKEFSVLPIGERVITLLSTPLYTLEFVPIYLQSFLHVRKNDLRWKQTERIIF